MASTRSAEHKFITFTTVFLCYASILTTHLHTIHTHIILFTVDNICDPKQSPSDYVDPFITQNNFIFPATQDQDDSQQAEPDLPETHSNRSKTQSLFEDHDDDLTNAQRNLLCDLSKHKTNVLKHEGLANHFNTLSSSPGPALPNFTKPTINLRDQKFFSSTCLNKLDEINKENRDRFAVYWEPITQKWPTSLHFFLIKS